MSEIGYYCCVCDRAHKRDMTVEVEYDWRSRLYFCVPCWQEAVPQIPLAPMRYVRPPARIIDVKPTSFLKGLLK